MDGNISWPVDCRTRFPNAVQRRPGRNSREFATVAEGADVRFCYYRGADFRGDTLSWYAAVGDKGIYQPTLEGDTADLGSLYRAAPVDASARLVRAIVLYRLCL